MSGWNLGPDSVCPAKSAISTSLDEAVTLRLEARDDVPVLSVYTRFKQTVDRLPKHAALGKSSKRNYRSNTNKNYST